jgi:hypothetical protein
MTFPLSWEDPHILGEERLEKHCRHYAISIYVSGVPATISLIIIEIATSNTLVPDGEGISIFKTHPHYVCC